MKFFSVVLVTGLVSLALLCFSVASAKMQLADAQYTERTFNQETLQDFKNDSDFEYANPPLIDPLKMSILQRIAHWFSRLFEKLPRGAWSYLPYILAAIAVILIIFYIRKITITGPLAGKSASVGDGEIFEENIHTIDFKKAIGDAIAAGQLRLATRLYFLMTLKVLDDRKLIQHSREKTNRDYLSELKNTPIKDEFSWLVRTFEFIWYGNMQPGQAMFESVEQRYSDFLAQIDRTATK